MAAPSWAIRRVGSAVSLTEQLIRVEIYVALAFVIAFVMALYDIFK